MKKIFTIGIIFTVTFLVTIVSSHISSNFNNNNINKAAEKYSKTRLRNFSSNCEYRERDFRVISRGILDGLNFFIQNIKNNLIEDAAVGPRIVEDNIQLALESKASFNIPPNYRKFLEKMCERAGNVSDAIVKNLVSDPAEENRLKNFNGLLWIQTKDLWKVSTEWKQLKNIDHQDLDKKIKEFESSVEILKEDFSDSCIGDLFNHEEITEKCQKIFLSGPLSKYSLTHQVIYVMIAKKMQAKLGNLDLDIYLEILCQNVYTEAKIIDAKNFPLRWRDLFSEQVALCGAAGFSNFLNPTWAYEILLWETSLNAHSACFVDKISTYSIKETNDEKRNEKIVSSQNKLRSLNRVKRKEMVVKENEVECSAHFTTVSIAALSMNLRYFLETCLL